MQKTRVTKSILTDVLKRIKPSKKQEEEIKNLADKTLELAKKEMKKLHGDAILAGSVSRNTWLVSKNEFDVFLVFPKNTPLEDMEILGQKIGKEIIEKLGGKWRIEYAQHPYIRGIVDNKIIDIVPCYAVKSGEQIISAVDRTPFHVKYLNENLPKELVDDVRLLKQFAASHRIYGADAKTQGFSGYICELLVINYGTFEDVLNAAVKWMPEEIIDIKGYWKEGDYPKLKKKFKDVLIIIDPVDRNRNAAAAISAETFFKFRSAAITFLKQPSTRYFFLEEAKSLTEKEFNIYMRRRETEFVAVKFKPPDVVPDILWPQLRKATKRLENIAKEYEFVVLRSDCWTDEKKLAVILLEMQVSRLPRIDKKIGPWIFDYPNTRKFFAKHKDAVTPPFVEGDYWVVEVERPWTKAKAKIYESLSENRMVLKAKGIPNYISEKIEEGFSVVDNKGLVRLLKSRDFAIFMHKYFEKEKMEI